MESFTNSRSYIGVILFATLFKLPNGYFDSTGAIHNSPAGKKQLTASPRQSKLPPWRECSRFWLKTNAAGSMPDA